MNYSLTVFNSIFDNKTDKRFNYDSWEKFEKVLYTLSDKKGYKAKRGERVKNASPLISPAIYVSETTRANANVTAWAGWAALDVDAYTGKYEHIAGRLGPYYTVCYSTASCTKENIKFRIVLPLTCHISADKIRHFWYALNKEFDQAGDEQTKDLSRMYYVPAKYPKAFNFIFTTKGAIMNPHELMAKHAFSERTGASFLDRLPPKMKEAIVANRKESMTNRDVHWSSYRDCPFLNKQLVINYKSIAGIEGQEGTL